MGCASSIAESDRRRSSSNSKSSGQRFSNASEPGAAENSSLPEMRSPMDGQVPMDSSPRRDVYQANGSGSCTGTGGYRLPSVITHRTTPNTAANNEQQQQHGHHPNQPQAPAPPAPIIKETPFQKPELYLLENPTRTSPAQKAMEDRLHRSLKQNVWSLRDAERAHREAQVMNADVNLED